MILTKHSNIACMFVWLSALCFWRANCRSWINTPGINSNYACLNCNPTNGTWRETSLRSWWNCHLTRNQNISRPQEHLPDIFWWKMSPSCFVEIKYPNLCVAKNIKLVFKYFPFIIMYFSKKDMRKHIVKIDMKFPPTSSKLDLNLILARLIQDAPPSYGIYLKPSTANAHSLLENLHTIKLIHNPTPTKECLQRLFHWPTSTHSHKNIK